MAPWLWMITLALSVYALCKWITFLRSPERLTHPVLYLFGWVGMDPAPFSAARVPAPRDPGLLLSASIHFLLGWALLQLAPHIANWLAQGWLVGAGIILMIHFGFITALAWLLQKNGYAVKPLMNRPLLAKSVTEFWGSRWNMAFRQLVYPNIFLPLKQRWGSWPAILTTFLFSGIVHDLVISIPAGGGYGLPTLYFMLQPLGMFVERSRPSRWFTYAVVAGPSLLLFHPPFIRNVILPMAHSMGIL